LIVAKYHNNNIGIISKNEINRLIGILIIPIKKVPRGSVIMTASMKTKNAKIELKSIIIKTITPRILGNLYNINIVGTKKTRIQIIKI
jgi:hypothetical protein